MPEWTLNIMLNRGITHCFKIYSNYPNITHTHTHTRTYIFKVITYLDLIMCLLFVCFLMPHPHYRFSSFLAKMYLWVIQRGCVSAKFYLLAFFRWRRQWHPTPVLLPGKSHGQRSLVGCSPCGRLRVGHDWVTSLSLFTFLHWRRNWQPTPVFLPGESQGRGTWWAAVYGVAQSQTWLKRLSSSSSSSMYIHTLPF